MTQEGESCYPVPGVISRPGDPENVAKKPWKITTPTPAAPAFCTNLHKHTMQVPLGDSDAELGIRAHEQLHVALTPLSPTLDDLAIQVAEEARIETIATREGLERDYGDQSGMLTKLLSMGRTDACWAFAVSSVGAPDEVTARQELAAWHPERRPSLDSYPVQMAVADTVDRETAVRMLEVMDWVVEQLAEDTTFAATERIAERLRSVLTPGANLNPPESRFKSKEPGKSPRRPPPKVKMPPDRTMRSHLIPVTPEELAPFVPMYGWPVHPSWFNPAAEGEHVWGNMEIRVPQLTRTVSPRGKSGRSSDYGTVLRQPWRLTSDDKVFRSRRHRRQGTVLVDLSGSMSLDPEDVENIIRAAPAAVVACYGGSHSVAGQLVVLADGGRMADRSHFHPGGANIVDGPAVEWLARQRTPRVLVTDYGFTYLNDNYIGGPQGLVDGAGGDHVCGKALYARLETARIKVVEHVSKAADFLL